ncbi:response regulator [Planctomycetota bacterium]
MEKILLVDDSKAVTYIVKKFLDKEGYSVKIAHNAYRGLDILRRGGFDLIITDIMMPGMDGYEFTEIVKNDNNLKHIPLIYFTAKGGLSDEFHGYMTGAEYFITKPVKKQDLLDKIEKALGKKNKYEDLGLPVMRGDLSSQKSRKNKPEIILEPERDKSMPATDTAFESSGTEEPTGPPLAKLQEIINIYGSMIEVMWAFSFDKLLTYENLDVIEQVIDKTCIDFPFLGHLAFSEDGIDLTRFKEKVHAIPIDRINRAFAALIKNFFDIIIEMSKKNLQKKYTVCILGDDDRTIADLEETFITADLDVKIAIKSEKALEDIQNAQADLVLLVMQSFGETNLSFCRRVRENTSASIPVFVVSSGDNREVRKLGDEALADEVISKPWSKLTLLHMIKKALGNF